jgi:hypothetical protein
MIREEHFHGRHFRLSGFDESARVNFPLPRGIARRSEYRIVHLAPAGKSRAWVEQPDAEFGSYGTSVTVPARETGIYALVHVAEPRGSENRPAQSPTR